ncbi:Bug family tripartite tricarboxylate transporter substrate binding protein [Nevskia soli]|uniref:Bug family tripartite tricarboxylate transporter substrate binding protein n=1 Tax=Nevskia soli TaxID=418856 RepID=UPI000A026BF4|nr:tripartite tricarboxylate transporter substrate-binding protein [Nevskia soli]
MSRIAMTIAAFLFASVPLAQAADSAEEFYKGKTITYVVSTAPGGGYDTYGRLVARYMNKYMPDSKIIIRNIPGAGHVVGANTIYAAKPDGLTIGTFNTGLIYLQLLKESGVRFDLAKMSWIGKAASDTRVLVVSKSSGVKTVQELLDSSKPPIKLFAAGVGSAGYIDTRLAISALHLNVQLIPGYNGSEGTMSMLRGETQGTIGSQSSYTQFVDDGNGVYIMEAGGAAGSKIPQADQFAKDDNARQLLKMIAAESDVARLTAGPPGIPADRLALLRSVFTKAMADPQLLADAKKMDAPIAPATGEHVQQVIADALQQTPQNLQLLTQAVRAGQ